MTSQRLASQSLEFLASIFAIDCLTYYSCLSTHAFKSLRTRSDVVPRGGAMRKSPGDGLRLFPVNRKKDERDAEKRRRKA